MEDGRWKMEARTLEPVDFEDGSKRKPAFTLVQKVLDD